VLLLLKWFAYHATTFWKRNWTTVSENAFQMNQCNNISHSDYQSSNSTKLFSTVPERKEEITCDHIIYVHDSKGNDLFDGTFEKPMKTIQAALSIARTLHVR
jgi:hypothetical protein